MSQCVIRLEATVVYEKAEGHEDALQARLHQLLDMAHEEGLFTDGLDAEVASYGSDTYLLGDLPLLQELVAAYDLDPADLDEVVHNVASEEAAACNNYGSDAQVEFLVRQLGFDVARAELQQLVAEKIKQDAE